MKKAIALVELVFAIVIIGITLLSVPNLISTATNSSSQVITQEAIANTASYINIIMSRSWDESSTKFNNPILKVSSGMDELSETNLSFGFKYPRRVGSALSTSRRFITDLNGSLLSANSTLGKEEVIDTDPDDIDDFNNIAYSLIYSINNTAINKEDYKDLNIQINTKIKYIYEAPTNTPSTFNKSSVKFDNPFNYAKVKIDSTNIKSIEVTLKSANDSNKRVILRAFSCNIGGSKLKERKF